MMVNDVIRMYKSVPLNQGLDHVLYVGWGKGRIKFCFLSPLSSASLMVRSSLAKNQTLRDLRFCFCWRGLWHADGQRIGLTVRICVRDEVVTEKVSSSSTLRLAV